MTSAASADTTIRLTGMDDVEQTIARAFEATMQNSVQTDLEALERAHKAFASNLDEILASCMRRRNATSSFQCRLPDELWSAIWEDDALTISDWISFSHVCHAWRRLALLSPRLWRDISFVTRPPPECSCTTCLDDETSHLEVQFARLDVLLPRSSPLPFNFRISCPDNAQIVSLSLILRLAQTFEPHGRRLARMHAEFDDPTKLCSFLGSLESLPTLRVLVADTTFGSTVDQRVSLPISRDRMPQLQTLNLSHWDFDYEPFPLADPCMLSVKDLSYTFTCADDLIRLFRSFPRLETVTLCPIDGDLAADFNSALDVLEIRRLAAKVQDVTLVDVSDLQEALFVDMFHGPERGAMTMDFFNTPHPASLSSLADLRESLGDGEVELALTCIGASSVLITAQTLDGRRRRRFTFPHHRRDDLDDVQILDRVFSRIWEFLPPSSVDTLVIDAETWSALPMFSSSSTRTTELRVVLRDEERYPFPWTGPHPARFPALRGVTVSTAGPWKSEIAAKSLVQFVKSLDPEGKGLKVVLQDGVSIVGQDDELRAMCGL
ncbi:hypothetical protein EXIGLDRAFT_832731 [Exidia glandulosa HHB12029]|uniref:Uncharacterized protein n=1 Tax=Exidia glandulosa HHB12029 TaxID=1314781 RepID=A0A165LAA5_EXIGL|nr:hypothetical protein EXIGLDRAFT_832731 [Exidia glandulosa HHB12029]